MKKIIFLSVALALFAVIGYSGYQLWDINRNSAQEAEMHSWLLQYHPLSQAPASIEPSGESAAMVSDSSDEAAPPPQVVNQSIVDLQAGRPSVVGWLTLPNTRIDYPFVQGTDNDHYLHLDLNDRWSAAGTLFMDFRNSGDLTDFHTIIYGHHMRNGSMFGTLQQFDNQSFFGDNRAGAIFLANATYEIEFMAFAVIQPSDAGIYNPTITTDAERTAFLDHVRSVARHYREIGATTNDRIITLSTCNYEFHNARMVLIGRLVEV